MGKPKNRLELYDKSSIAQVRRDHGGGFVSALGAALWHADPINSQKIVDVFSNYVEDYEDQIKELDKASKADNPSKETTYKVWVMSSTRNITANTADVAVVALSMYLQATPPIAIYEPEGIKSKYSWLASPELDQTDAMAFISKNSDAIKRAYDTITKLS